jgi:hypothetical protein
VAGVAGELVVVFLGVWIALAAESWWQGRADRNAAHSNLASVHLDMTASMESIRTALEENGDLSDWYDSVWDLVGADTLPHDSVAAPVLLIAGEPEVPVGALNALVESGDVDLLRDKELRSVLVGLHSTLEQHRSSLARYFDGALANNQELRRAREGVRSEHDLKWGPIPLAIARTDPSVRAAFESHIGVLRNRRNIMRRMATAIDRVLPLINAELGH